MSKIREGNAQQLMRASDMLGPVAETAVRPAQCIRPALELATQAYGDMQNYLVAADKSQLRVGILRLRGVLAALDANRRIGPGDYDAVHATAAEMRELATRVTTRNSTGHARPTMQYSALGLRFSPLAEQAAQSSFVTVENGERIRVAIAGSDDHHDEAMRAGMPRTLKPGQGFALFRCPIVAFTKSFIGDVALDRSGLKWHRGGGGVGGGLGVAPGLGRVGAEGLYSVILDNQILVGFDRKQLAEDRDGVVRRAADQLQSRLGQLVPPLGEHGRFLISPGNPLDWLWLVPTRVMSTTHMTVREASFPWKTTSVAITAEQQRLAQREVQQLNQQMEAQVRLGKEIDVRDLTRQSQLMETLDRAKNATGNPDLATRRIAMQQLIDKRSATPRAQLLDLQQQLKEVGKVPALVRQAKDLKLQIKQLQLRIEKIRDEEMLRARKGG